MFTDVWQPTEDYSLVQIVKDLGTQSWSKVSLRIRTKTAAQCKFRYQFILTQPIYFRQLSDVSRPGIPELNINKPYIPPQRPRGRPPLHPKPRPIVIDECEKEKMDPETRKIYEKTCEKFNSLLDSSKIILNNNVCDWEEYKDRSLCDQIISKGKYEWEAVEGPTTSAFPQFCKLRWALLGLGSIDCNFSSQEDQDIMEWVDENGVHNWDKATQKIACRSQKQLESRYKYLEAAGKTIEWRRSKKRYMKEFEDCNDRYNFDRLIDNIHTKAFKNCKQLLDLSCLNSVLDMDQKTQLKRASERAKNVQISSIISLSESTNSPDQEILKKVSCDKPVEPKWTIKENQILFKAHKELGSNWAQISSLFLSRFPRSIKAHFLEVLRCISGKFTKKPITEEGKFKGYSYQPRDANEEISICPTDKELIDYAPLMYKLLKIDEAEIDNNVLLKIDQLREKREKIKEDRACYLFSLNDLNSP